MKKYALTMLLTAVTLTAEAAGFGVVDVQAVFNGTDLAKKTGEELRAESDNVRAQIAKMDSDLAAREQELIQKKSVLSEEAYLDEVAELRRISRNYRAELQSEQDVLNAKQRRIRNKITDEIEKVVKAVAAEQELEMVLPGNMMLYVGEGVDLTADVLAKVNENLNAEGM